MPKKYSIYFFKEEVRFRLSHASQLQEWIKQVIVLRRKTPGEINFVFCNDRYLRKLNKKYLHHDTLTDILTFDTSSMEGVISGDIFISIDRVRSNAIKYNSSFNDELHRVMVHGVLHLLGFADKTRADKSRMRSQEDECLELRNFY